MSLLTNPFYVIAGIGQTGLAVAAFLTRRNQPFVFFDTRDTLNQAILSHDYPDIPVFLSHMPASLYPKIIAVIVSPGVPLDHAFIKAMQHHAIPLKSDIDCLIAHIDAPIVAITGTNGKSTVTTLVGEILKHAGLKVAVAGNIGVPVLTLLDDDIPYDVWVLELSSFQLELTHTLKAKVAGILNITPDHLDRHGTFDAYQKAKQRVYHHACHVVYNREDEHTHSPYTHAHTTSVGLSTPALGQWGLITEHHTTYLAWGHHKLLDTAQLTLQGRHNWLNVLTACAMAQAMHVSRPIILQAIAKFKGLPHRCQWVRTLNGVRWINDSKGTNVGATFSAIMGIGERISGRIILIAGGLGKNADFTQLKPVVRQFVRSVLVLGADGSMIAEALKDVVKVTYVASLEEAVFTAYEQARALDVVLLSPACASQDMFRDFNHRGEVFSQQVVQL